MTLCRRCLNEIQETTCMHAMDPVCADCNCCRICADDYAEEWDLALADERRGR